MKKGKFNLGKLFKTLVIVGIFAIVPLVFVGCSIGGGGAKEYSISYVLDGGTNSDSNPTKIDKDMGEVWLQDPTREDYYFYGWYKDKYYNQPISKISFDELKGDLTLYAVWRPISYSIHYELNGGEDKYRNRSTYSIETFFEKDDTPRDIRLVDPTREGYAFAGWYMNEDFSDDAAYGIAVGTRGDLTLYAKWTPNTYTVTFNKNSANASGSMSDQSFTYGVEQSLSDNKFTRAGYAFAGWEWENAYGKKIILADEEEVSNLTTENGGTVELVAVWKAVFTIENGSITGLTAYGKTLTTIEIPSSIDGKKITEIGAEAFEDCRNLTEITISDSVTKIGNDAFRGCSNLTSITIPDSVTSIDYNAFIYCGKLTSIELPSKLTEIANGLFYGCGLTEITIPDGVESIGSNAFNSCSSLESITIPNSVESIGYNAFYECSKLTKITIPSSVTTIEKYTFCGCEELATVTFKSDTQLTTIGEGAFAGCNKLASISIPSSVETIGVYAFNGCSSLESITIPTSVKTIEKSTFAGCSSLVSFKVPTGITTIDESAFNKCTSLRLVYIPNSVTTISASQKTKSPFYGCDDSLVIYCGASSEPSGWSYDWNFYKYKNNTTTAQYLTVVWGITGDVSLTSDFAYVVMEEEGEKEVWLLKYIGTATTVEIPSEIEKMHVTKIYKNCFYGKSSITSVTIPNSITSIGPYAFSGCSGLTSVTFVENSQLASIGNYAFQNCSGLTSISIPSSVTSIGEGAFKNCTNLTSVHYNANLTKALTKDSNVFYKAGTSGDGIAVTFGEGVTSIPVCLFGASRYDYASKIKSITIPAGVTSIGEYAFKFCTGLEEINFNATLTTDLTSESQIFYCAQSSEAGCVLKLGEGIKTVPAYLFHSSSMTSITIPDDVTSIGNGAFRYCDKMTTFTIPESVTTIGEYAFCNCSGLKQITIPNSVKSIDSYAFAGSGLTSIEIPKGITTIKSYTFKSCTSLTSVIIPDSVTTIEEYAFQTCNFTSITIPDTVKSIGLGAFNGCTNMTSITIPFVGASAEEGETKTHFAYIFGAESNNQTDNQNNHLTYSINKVVITGGKIIANRAFYDCSLKSIIIQGGVETIESRAFMDCSHLRSLVISTSVKSIGSSICYSRNSELESVYYAGTSAEWESISIDSDNYEFNSVSRYYYSESDPTANGNYWRYVDDVITVWTQKDHGTGFNWWLDEIDETNFDPISDEVTYKSIACDPGDCISTGISIRPGSNVASIFRIKIVPKVIFDKNGRTYYDADNDMADEDVADFDARIAGGLTDDDNTSSEDKTLFDKYNSYLINNMFAELNMTGWHQGKSDWWYYDDVSVSRDWIAICNYYNQLTLSTKLSNGIADWKIGLTIKVEAIQANKISENAAWYGDLSDELMGEESDVWNTETGENHCQSLFAYNSSIEESE